MMYRHINFEESYVHQCADADRYTTEHKREMAQLRRHDCHTFMVIPASVKLNGDTNYKIIPVKYCPYCGVDLEKDETTEKFLKLKLL